MFGLAHDALVAKKACRYEIKVLSSDASIVSRNPQSDYVFLMFGGQLGLCANDCIGEEDVTRASGS
jgi:hypothetical protein